MENLPVPEGYQQVMPYLVVRDAEGFFRFAQKVFNAKEKLRVMHDDHHVMHAEITIGDSTIMFADAIEDWKPQSAGLFIYVDEADETYKKALAEGASSVVAMSNQDYGRSGGVCDPYGNTWWITGIKKI